MSRVIERRANCGAGLSDNQMTPPVRNLDTILVVEDDDNIRTYVAQVLSGGGYRVLAVADGQEGLNAFKKHLAIRLVLLDLTMPGWDGREVAGALRELRPDLPIIFMSGYSRPEMPTSETHVEKYVFLQKPFRPHELIALVNQQLVEASRQEY
jgi:two-component system, cell cycle sensor histidine kinase and response regulator CckA